MGANFRSNSAKLAVVAMTTTVCVLSAHFEKASAQTKADLPVCSKVVGEDGSALHPLSRFVMSDPLVGETRTAEVGQPILSSTEVAEFPDTLILRENISYTGRGPAAGFSITLPAGSLKIVRDTREFALYRSEIGTVFKKGSRIETPVELVRKVDKTQPLRLFWLDPSSSFLTGARPFADDLPNAAYEVRGCIGPTRTNYRKEIVYSGVTGKSISLLYREFSGDLARPAFSQNLTYDLSAGDEIGYKGARLRIASATNTAITFEVQRALE